MQTLEPLGRRERKKAATRKAISDIATRMFLERGFDAVSVKEIADAADVSATTVFAHFPRKETLIFDEDDEGRDDLISAIRSRPRGTTVSAAVWRHMRDGALEVLEHGEHAREFMELVDSTPALREFAQQMWTRHEDAIAVAIAEDFGLSAPSPEIRVFARIALQLQPYTATLVDPVDVIDAGFGMLDAGWSAYELTVLGS